MRSGAKSGSTSGDTKNPLGMHFVDVLVSDKYMPFSLGVNTQFSTISLVSTNCAAPNCDVAQKYDPSLSNTK